MKAEFFQWDTKHLWNGVLGETIVHRSCIKPEADALLYTAGTTTSLLSTRLAYQNLFQLTHLRRLRVPETLINQTNNFMKTTEFNS